MLRAAYDSEVHSRLHRFFDVSPGRGNGWIASPLRWLTVCGLFKVLLVGAVLLSIGLLCAYPGIVALAMLAFSLACLVDVFLLSHEFRDAETLAKQRRDRGVCVACGAERAAELSAWCEQCGFEDAGSGRFHTVKSTLARLPDDAPPRQFSLAALFIVMTTLCVMLASFHWFESLGVAICGSLICLYCTVPNLLGIQHYYKDWVPKFTVLECLVLLAITFVLASLFLPATVSHCHRRARTAPPPAATPGTTGQPVGPSAAGMQDSSN